MGDRASDGWGDFIILLSIKLVGSWVSELVVVQPPQEPLIGASMVDLGIIWRWLNQSIIAHLCESI